MEENNSAEKKTKRNKLVVILTAVIPCIVAASILFAQFQMRRLEEGVLELCAEQQDAYVELVLRDLHQQEGDEEALVNWLLAAPAAPNGGYWTFAGEQTVFFVKDAQETNRFKGFTPATYYASESAGNFFLSLQSNRVTHAQISLEGKNLMASGAVFSHQGRSYTLCLLTESGTLLEGNSLMEAKMGLWLLIGAVLIMLLLVPALLALGLRRLRGRQIAAEKDAAMLNERLKHASARLSREDLHDTRNNLWKIELLPKFVMGLQDKGAAPVTFMLIYCATRESRSTFLSTAGYLLDRNVLRFEAGGYDLILAFVGVERVDAISSVQPLLTKRNVLVCTSIAKRPDDMENAIRELLQTAKHEK